jgi:hypothetical protein
VAGRRRREARAQHEVEGQQIRIGQHEGGDHRAGRVASKPRGTAPSPGPRYPGSSPRRPGRWQAWENV